MFNVISNYLLYSNLTETHITAIQEQYII